MKAEGISKPDWRDAAAYAPLLDADRSLFAWEWLRRDPLYRLTFAGRCMGQADPRPFGLVAFEDPGLPVPNARPLWRADAHPYVLRTEPDGPGPAADLFDLRPFGDIARVVSTPGTDHLLLSDGLRAIRLDGTPGLFGRSRCKLRYLIGGLVSAEAPLLTLRRLLALCASGRFARSLHQREARARRWILMLRAWDGTEAGADQRGIAEALLSGSVGKPAWRTREPSVRSQAQRLVRCAREIGRGGYRRLL